MIDWHLILESFLRATRATAGVTGALVVLDSIGILLRVSERPPHNPRWNAAAWLVIAAVTVAVSGYLLAGQYVWIAAEETAAARAAVVALWSALVVSFTLRKMARSERPLLPLSAVLLMLVFGVAFGLLDPAP